MDSTLVCPLLSPYQKVLVICEKPSLARDLGGVLGAGSDAGGFLPYSGGMVSWARGHFLELVMPEAYNPDWAKWVWEVLPMVPENLQFRSEVKEGAREQLRVLKGLYGEADAVINACDAGREGELIWWEILRHCGWGKGLEAGVPGAKPAFRFWAQSNTPAGLREAWQDMRPIADRKGLALAAFSRGEADWLLGMNASRAATLCFPAPQVGGKRGVWSVGRVQTPVLALVFGRDAEIAGFVSKPFYEVRGFFQGDEQFEATFLVPDGVPPFLPEGASAKEVKGFLNRSDAQQLLDRVLGSRPGPWEFTDDEKPVVENAPHLFSLTDLQKWCNQSWGWPAKRTLDAAQSAYETGKTLSYPRTDANFLPVDTKSKMDTVYAQVRSGFLDGRFALPAWSTPPSASGRASFLFDDSKLTDHYAIVPTGVIPGDLTSDAGMVWLAVLRRFITAFGPAAQAEQVRRRLVLGADVAVASGKRYLSRGWMEADDLLAPLCGQDPKALPSSLPGAESPVPLLDGKLHEGKTSPPKPLTEATLLGMMENIQARLDSDEDLKEAMAGKGLGTPATRAAIIELLLFRGYLAREKRGGTVAIRTTESGRALIDNLRSEDLGFLTSPVMTAEWEGKLVDMEQGKGEGRQEFLEGLLLEVRKVVDKLRARAAANPVAGALVPRKELSEVCPLSGKPIGDLGSFWEFPGFPGRIPKVIAGRDFTLDEVSKILSGSGEVLHGFMSKKGNKFSASMKPDFESRRFEFVFADRPTTEAGVCPVTGEPVVDHGGFWVFPRHETKLWKQMSRRDMKLSEYAVLVEHGKSELLEGFVSSKGTRFSAFLVWKDGGGVGFEFAPRPGGGPSSPGMRGPGAKPKPAPKGKKTKKTW